MLCESLFVIVSLASLTANRISRYKQKEIVITHNLLYFCWYVSSHSSH
nr:MAG TPA: hypothetical protein [Caudoviricetes sp.]